MYFVLQNLFSFIKNDIMLYMVAFVVSTEAAVQRCSLREGVLKIFSKFTGEHTY